jgi:SAM-dependent methyltransferase
MKRLKRLLRNRIVRIVREEAQSIIANRYIAGKLFPLDPTGPYHLLAKRNREGETATVDFPVPPEDMWEGYGRTKQEYLASGLRHMTAMVDILAKGGARADDFHRVLDFGCGAGRLLRFFPRKGKEQEMWGVDINAQYMSWCQNHLSPPFLFATTTTLPHVPFEDNSFDLVYCGSVFTHVTDLADAWFLELRRILRKGGYAYITIQDKLSMQAMLSRYRAAPLDPESVASFVKVDGEPGTSPMGLHAMHEADRATGVASKDFASFAYSIDPFSNIFYDTQFLVDKWSRFAEVVSVTPAAYGSQTALLCRKRS